MPGSPSRYRHCSKRGQTCEGYVADTAAVGPSPVDLQLINDLHRPHLHSARSVHSRRPTPSANGARGILPGFSNTCFRLLQLAARAALQSAHQDQPGWLQGRDSL